MSIEKPNKPVLTEEDLEYICDSVCRYPYISTSEEELKKYCEGCVITKKLRRVIDMTINEAIAKYKEITNTDANCPAHCNISCDKCVQESKQIAEWLEDYKRIKMLIPIEQALKNEYNKAVDDLIAKCENAKFAESDEISLSDIHTGVNSGLSMAIHFAEQLKAGGENE